MHSQISGTVDFREPDDESCLAAHPRPRRQDGRARIRAIFSHIASRDPLYPAEEIYGIFSSDPGKQYDMREIIARIVDASEFEEYRAEYGETLLCGYARIGGWAVGIVANQKKHVHTTRRGSDQKRIEFGGVIYTESAEKAARFILDCNQNRIPLIFLHDVNGFMVGKDAEWSGIIRAGAKMVNAVANSVVPKISVICGGSFGAGHYAMCGKAYDPRFIFAWPTARYAVMSGDAAASTLVEIKLKQLEREGKKLDEKAKKELYESTARHLRTPNRPALRRRPPLGRRHHRPRQNPRLIDLGARSRRPELASPGIQNRGLANVTTPAPPPHKTEQRVMRFAGVLLLPSLFRLILSFLSQGNPAGAWWLFAGFANLSDCSNHHSFSGFRSFSRAPHGWAVLLLVIMEIGFVGSPAWFAVKLVKNPFV